MAGVPARFLSSRFFGGDGQNFGAESRKPRRPCSFFSCVSGSLMSMFKSPATPCQDLPHNVVGFLAILGGDSILSLPCILCNRKPNAATRPEGALGVRTVPPRFELQSSSNVRTETTDFGILPKSHTHTGTRQRAHTHRQTGFGTPWVPAGF